jgi:L-lactate dehydrogenase complex protein LldF
MNKAVQDTRLRAALDKALGLVQHKRRVMLQELPDQEEARQRVSDLRRYSVDNAGALLQAFEAKLQEGGITVHWAADALDAAEVLLDIAKRHGVTSAVFAKSMLAEELEIEHALKTTGVEVFQTDLGERVVQLAGQKPSHITAPCLHMSAAMIGQLFHDKLGIPYTEDATELTLAARVDLRKAFFAAGLGVSGANLGIAESGTIVLVENEGNIRMTTLMPPVLVSFMGIEKVVPDLESAHSVLNLLAKNATGQRLPGYVSFITPDWPGDGLPIERHVVLVDAGRTRIFGDGGHRSLLWCIRCGACQNTCPVYGRVGGHAYGHTYSGPIGACLAPLLSPSDDNEKLPFASSLCGACGEVCPAKIPLPAHLLRLRATKVAKGRGTPLVQRLGFRVWRFFMQSTFAYNLSLFFHRLGQALLPGLVHAIAGRLGWHSRRRIPRVGKSFRAQWKKSRRSS